MIDANLVTRMANESYEDYFVRLFENKREYGLNCSQIAELLNCVNGKCFTESAYRKEYAAFNRGRLYERRMVGDNVGCRILALSDMHYPFNLDSRLVLKDYTGRVDVLVLNGDLLDMYSCSKFTKLYRQSPVEEMIGCRNYLITLIKQLKPKKVVATYGNHEMRMQR